MIYESHMFCFRFSVSIFRVIIRSFESGKIVSMEQRILGDDAQVIACQSIL